MIPNFGLIMLCAIIAIGTGVVVAIFDEKKKKWVHNALVEVWNIMALSKCNECGRVISDKASICPHCGCPLKNVIVRCPKCDCPNISITNRGHTLSWGLLGSKMKVNLCNDCGYKWRPPLLWMVIKMEECNGVKDHEGYYRRHCDIFVGIIYVSFPIQVLGIVWKLEKHTQCRTFKTLFGGNSLGRDYLHDCWCGCFGILVLCCINEIGNTKGWIDVMKKILLGIAVILFSAMCCVIYKEYHWDFLEVVYVFSPFVGLGLAVWGVLEKERD